MSGCPDCGDTVIQFLVGRGAFCLGCGRLRHRIKDPANPYVTIECDSLPAEALPRMTPAAIRAQAIEDALVGPIQVEDAGGSC